MKHKKKGFADLCLILVCILISVPLLPAQTQAPGAKKVLTLADYHAGNTSSRRISGHGNWVSRD
jgi:hypothetical protein